MRTLDVKCTECSGNGTKPGYKQVCKKCYGSTITTSTRGLPKDKQEKCNCIDGLEEVKETICRYCKGIGYNPTEYGWKMLRHKELVKFIRRHTH